MSRVHQLATELGKENADAYFAQHPISLGYLAGFPEDSHERFMVYGVHHSGKTVLICPALSADQASRAGIQDIRSWTDEEDPMQLFLQLAEEWNLRSGILYVDDKMPASMLLKMQNTCPAALYKIGGPVLGRLMSIKDLTELDYLRQAGAIADAVFEAVIPQIRVGMTELELQDIIQHEMQKRGGKPAFCIVGFGAGSAEPHHLNGDTRLTQNTIVLLDFGCTFHGYYSDITRTLCFGSATEEQKMVYDLVAQAHRAAQKLAHSGAVPAEVDAAARNVIASAGYGQNFTHRTGHGVGAAGHESPDIASYNLVPLADHNCFSIEPGIYLTGKFGVRLENLYYSTASGAVSFNQDFSDTLVEI